ncbi:MAG TPA: hypothetical protein RMH85_18080 [Polyangiaceae bacterium LLY-WYZ-15_(1-7)]|nr:hypothetical protein [Myxococcales bacterium]MAT28487.1 hypothetical protein [Sandaracinus sp.]HJL04176.1 hypothetical protein [Polyangiaceae bacterium LLY-WYZ-15_(1-7)]MBJ71834.1 hypothetical protein [Sandaracinus sp.]HJL10414.1 hypothetical protein [Polyangiaceae bacterium LLY-WYZ-15_(1-7)]
MAEVREHFPERARAEDSRAELQRAFEGSLGPWADRAPALAALFAPRGLAALEASLRLDGRAITGLRMMVEGVQREEAGAALDALGVPRPALLEAPIEAPFIVGWDAARRPPVAKLYLNLSDASADARAAVARALALPRPAHVIGLNLPREGAAETKLYAQREALPEDAPAPLRAWAEGLPLAGVVVCHALEDGALRPRAHFVAPRSDAPVDGALRRLPGWDDATARAALPFAPGLVKSVGADVAGRFTVYVKPRAHDGALFRLDPVLCLAGPRGEIGLFVEPASAPRAWARTGEHALSYRVRAGAPGRAEVERAMRWALAQLEAGALPPTPSAAALAEPPEGWRVVAA